MSKYYIVSKCLLGCNCKYDGGNNYCQEVIDFLKGKQVIEVCPEVMGGMSTPRIPSEIKDDKVINELNVDVTTYFNNGVEACLKLIENKEIELAVLKAKSPSCGYKKIYDGTFTKTLIDGHGMFARKIVEKNIPIITEKDLKG